MVSYITAQILYNWCVGIETDTMGEVAVPADRYWGAQTQRSLQNFKARRTNNDTLNPNKP